MPAIIRSLFVVLLCVGTAVAHEGHEVADAPLPLPVKQRYAVEDSALVSVETQDGQRLSGKLLSYDLEEFDLGDEAEDAQRIAWGDVSALEAISLLGPVIDTKSAEENFRLGRILAGLDDGADLADRIFQNAVRLDPRYEGHVNSFRESGEVLPALAPARVEAAPALTPAKPLAPIDPLEQASKYTWKSLSEEEMAGFIAEEKKFVAAVLEYLEVEMRLIETEHYLFYTNADPREVAKMSVLLENMYRRLSEMLDIPPSVNIWKGKALVILCAEEELYHRIEREVFGNTKTQGTVGICHAFGTGEVRICFRMMEDPWNLRHLLVHETTHGFLHRYRSAELIPNWFNEGLAEYMGTRLVVPSQFNKVRRIEGQKELVKRGGFEGALDAPNIPHWFYGVSLVLVEMLMQEDREAVFQMLRDIKDGDTWQDALQNRFDLTPQQMANRLRDHLRLSGDISLD